MRAGLNEVEPETLRLFRERAERHGNVELLIEPTNTFKNPLMRRLFYERPLTSEWTVWCDDDTHFTRPDWLARLRRKIRRYPSIAVWGAMYFQVNRNREFLQWIRSAAWFRGRPFERPSDPVEAADPEASRFVFASGGFWMARTEVLQELDWPDPRLLQAAEDVAFGEALRQNGYSVGPFEYGVCVSDAPRRNASAPEIRNPPPQRRPSRPHGHPGSRSSGATPRASSLRGGQP